MRNEHQIYLISDSTGETLDRIFLALKAQFTNFEYELNNFSFTRTENQIQQILEKAKRGTEIIFIPGNHDEVARDFIGLTMGGIKVKDDDIHYTADGKKFWVVHGDLFDNVIQHARWLAYIGDWAYVFLLKTNAVFNAIRRLFKLPYWSLSQYLKSKVKLAVSFMSAFEKSIATETRRRGCDGVICGHIHKAEMKMVEDIMYANDGDWVESMTALVENFDGKIEIIEWAKTKGKLTPVEGVK